MTHPLFNTIADETLTNRIRHLRRINPVQRKGQALRTSIVLQQLWKVYRDGDVHEEWRDVPTAGEDNG